jgi:hypothetical protein
MHYNSTHYDIVTSWLYERGESVARETTIATASFIQICPLNKQNNYLPWSSIQ